MPRGPRGEWRPRDPFACAAHVMGILTGRTPEAYEPPAGHQKPKPPDPAVGGRARAAKLSPEERSASASRAVGARWRKGATA